MAKLNSLLAQRLFKKEADKPSKMTQLATLSTSGNLSSFAGVFKINPLSSLEKEKLESILFSFKEAHNEFEKDLESLVNLTSEVKAINNQAAILHGERIKKAQEILKNYKEGAFSSWLVTVYGNRQTPYNFLQYYELYQMIPEALHLKLDSMPRQAVYTLASRKAPLSEKIKLISSYRGEAKDEVLSLIRKTFPLLQGDGRKENFSLSVLSSLLKTLSLCEDERFSPSDRERKDLKKVLSKIRSYV